MENWLEQSSHLSSKICFKPEHTEVNVEKKKKFSWQLVVVAACLQGFLGNVQPFPTCNFFFKVEISSCTLILLFRPESVHSGSVSWDDWPNVPWQIACELISRYGIGSHTIPGQWHWVKGVCVFKCNLPPALLAEWLGSFTYHCGNTGVEWTLNKSQHTKLTLEKKILLRGFELTTFQSRVQRSYQHAILAPFLTNVMSDFIQWMLCQVISRRFTSLFKVKWNLVFTSLIHYILKRPIIVSVWCFYTVK